MNARTIYVTMASNSTVMQKMTKAPERLGPNGDCHNIRLALTGVPEEVSDDAALDMASATGFVFLGENHGWMLPFQKLNPGGLVAIR
jgi:hypothetical protein